MVLAQFRQHYPQGSLVSELVDIDRGTYIVKVSVTIDRVILATGLAGAERVEIAEDLARERAIAALFLDGQQITTSTSSLSNNRRSSEVSMPTRLPTNLTSELTPDVPKVAEAVLNSSTNEPMVNLRDGYLTQQEPVDRLESPLQEKTSQAKDTTTESSSVIPAAVSLADAPPPQIITQVEASLPVAKSQLTQSTGNLFEGTFNPEVNLELAQQEHIATETAADDHSPTNSQPELEMTDFDFMQVKQKTDLEIERLAWTKDYGREFIKSRYGKRTRLHLTNEQLLEFLQYLESQPTPN